MRHWRAGMFLFAGLVAVASVIPVPAQEIPSNTPKSDVFMQGFYWNSNPGGIWWDSLASLAPRIGSAGFGAVWFPSPVKGQGGGFSMGYDPFDHFDFGEYNQKGSVETRFGSRQELINAINAFHNVGVEVFADAVMGHMNGGDLVPVDCEPFPSYQDSAYVLFTYPNGSGRFPKNASHFYPNQLTCDVNPPYHGPYDQIFKFGEVPAHNQPYVQDSMIAWGQYMKNVLKFDGWRIDAVKHIDPLFVGPWQQAVGGYAVAEYYGSTSEISNWLYWSNQFGGDISMFDFPLRFSLKDMCNNTGGTYDMTYLDGAGLVNAGISGYDVATFVENHDLDRTGWDGSTDNGHAPILTDKDMAYGYIIFSEGRPCVFFRDYFVYGLANTIDRLIWIREKFLYGSTTKRDGLAPYYVGSAATQEEQARDIYVARRNGGNGRPQTFLVMNDHPTEWRGVWVNSSHPNQVFRDYMGVAIDKQAAGDGRVELYAPPRGIAVYVPDTSEHVNHHPYVNFVDDQAAFTITPFSYQVTAGDLDGDSLLYSLSGQPLWLSITPEGLLTGTPGASDTATSSVIVHVADVWGGSTSDTFNVTVRSRPVMDGVYEGTGVWNAALIVADTLAGWDGAEAKEVYVVQDNNYVYFGASVRARQGMNWVFAINTKSGGGTSDSWGRNISYIHPNKPDFVLRGHFQSYAELHTWNGSSWTGVGNPLASTEFGEGIPSDSLEEGWVEARVLKSALGNPPSMQVQFYLTGHLNSHATYDACPDDQNTTAWTGSPTSLRYYGFFGNKQITQANLQFPANGVINGGGSFSVFGRAFALGVTDSTGPGSGLLAWIGYNPASTNPATWTTWVPATFNVDAGQSDEYTAEIGSTLGGGVYYYATRFQYTGGPYLYGGYSSSGGGFWNGSTNISGFLVVQAPPAMPSLSSPSNGALHLPPTTVLSWNPVGGFNSFRVQVSTDSLFATTVFDDSNFTATFRSVGGLTYGTKYFWRVKAKNAYGSSAYTAPWSFTVFVPQTVNIQVNQNWNTISIPLTIEDGQTNHVFPTATSSAYAFDPLGGYVLRDTVTNGSGYWLKFPGSGTVPITGGLRPVDSIAVLSGWNLVGSITGTTAVSAIVQVPDSIIRSVYYTYAAGYAPSDSIEPGKAYWVKTASQGKLVLSTEGAAPAFMAKQNPLQLLDRMNEIHIEDAAGNRQVLYFGSDREAKAVREYFTLPPTPPMGIFDVRFASQRLLETVEEGASAELPLRILSAEWPVTINVVSRTSSPRATLAFSGSETPLQEGTPVRISREMPVSLRLDTAAELPLEFALGQNYPNPFNPTTTIQFDLPVASEVSLKLYDILGREVAILARGIKPAGTHFATVDGTSLGTGVYFYKIEAGGYQSTRKLLLLK